MPIDINLVRSEKGGNPSVVRESEIKRGRSDDIVTKLIDEDINWRKKNFILENLKKDLNQFSKQIGQEKKKNPEATSEHLITKCNELNVEIKQVECELEDISTLRNNLLHSIGNIIHKDVPIDNDEKNNKILRTSGYVRKLEEIDINARLNHFEIMQKLNILDVKSGAELAGHRGYFLKSYGVALNMALLMYGLTFLRRHGYEEIQPPYMMRREVMKKASELEDFENTLYKISDTGSDAIDADKNDLFLIATSEQPMVALHRQERLDSNELPIKYAGVSTCFRKEAGSHGKDMLGIFRVHQFEKVEQFVITTPEDSEKAHAEMIEIAEKFYTSLGIPYRVVSIVSGALNNAASIKYDLEGWFPSHNEYRELVSCSNCTDYQSRAFDVKVITHKSKEQYQYAHMLNATLVANQRTMCCILENFQTPTGVWIPRPLMPYMDGMEFLPYPTS